MARRPSTARVIAVTGTIGSGKSAVLGLFAEAGLATLSADAIAREVVAPGTEGFRAVVAAFGPEIVDERGELDRGRLGTVVFSDEAKRTVLNALTHPRIRARLIELTQALLAEGNAVVVIEIPLLTPTALSEYGIDDVIIVCAPEAVALDRLVRLRGLDPDDASARLRAQVGEGISHLPARWRVVNDGDLATLRAQVEAILEDIKEP